MSEFKEIETIEDALAGANDIIAENIAETAELREDVRKTFYEDGIFRSLVHPSKAKERSKYEMYYDYKSPVKSIPSHNMLAIRRGEKEGFLIFTIETDEELIIERLKKYSIKNRNTPCGKFMEKAIDDSYERLMKNSLIGAVRLAAKETADDEAIKNFEANLNKLLLSPPAGAGPVLALDPGFRTGCKMVALNENGKFEKHSTIFPTQPKNDTVGASKLVEEFISKYNIKIIAIGNGTASRETELFVKDFLKSENGKKLQEKLGHDIKVIIVNESGASVYSASQAAIDEFPNEDVTVRGSISIGRRLQDPLAELVKIEPKSLGVGQYQHDVDQNRLKKRLGDVVESCVNSVGVDLNTASPHLLSYVAGISKTSSKAIVDYRNNSGAFRKRKQLLKVSGIGAKAYEQCAGFLRIRNGENPLDNSAVHPERYGIVKKMAGSLKTDISSLIRNESLVKSIKPTDFINEAENAGLPTIEDILNELMQPGRDPRKEFKTAAFKDNISEIKDLKEGLVLEGNVTNVTNFGAFVDIGVHQDGLVHISELANRFVKNPMEVVSVGDIVKVMVLSVDTEQKRISLSIKQTEPGIKQQTKQLKIAKKTGSRRPVNKKMENDSLAKLSTLNNKRL